jgi:single-strand DNA-binding protein
MNIIHVSGVFTKKPEIKEVTAGERVTKVVNFVLASSRRFKKKDGSPDEETTFVNCEAWDSGAETIAKWFDKGDSIIVHGSLKNERWEDKDGNKRYRDKVRVSSFEFPPRSSKKSSDESPEETTETHEEASSQEVPF